MQIAALDGVDVLFVGPADLSHSLGVPGRFTEPGYQEAMRTVVAACRRHGKAAGILLYDHASFGPHLDLGFTLHRPRRGRRVRGRRRPKAALAAGRADHRHRPLQLARGVRLRGDFGPSRPNALHFARDRTDRARRRVARPRRSSTRSSRCSARRDPLTVRPGTSLQACLELHPRDGHGRFGLRDRRARPPPRASSPSATSSRAWSGPDADLSPAGRDADGRPPEHAPPRPAGPPRDRAHADRPVPERPAGRRRRTSSSGSSARSTSSSTSPRRSPRSS